MAGTTAAARRALLLALLARAAQGVYFHVESTPRCFIEEVPPETLVVGAYKNPDFVPFGQPDFTGASILITVKDPKGAVVLRKHAEEEGKFAWTSQVGGEFSLCFAGNSSRWASTAKKMRFDLKLSVGEMGIDYAEVAKKEHLSELEVEIRRLNDKVKDIMREQSYQREREVSFRDTSESTNSRVQWWSLLQVGIMLASGIWQIMHLKAFFQTKKVV